MTDDVATFAARLKAARLKAKLQPDDVGAVLGMQAHSYRAIERGESAKQYVQLANLAAALGTTPNALLGIEDAPRFDTLNAALGPFLAHYGATPEQCALIAQSVLTAIEQPLAARGRLDPLEDLAVRAEILARLLFAEGRIGLAPSKP